VELSIPSPTAKLPPSRQQRQRRLWPPQPGSDLLISSSSTIRWRLSQSPTAPVPPLSPQTAMPSHPPVKHPAGGWERLAALPRRFSFIKHRAGGGFSHAVGTAESLFSAASGRKMEGRQETGRLAPPPAAGGPSLFGFQRGRQKEDITEGLRIKCRP